MLQSSLSTEWLLWGCVGVGFLALLTGLLALYIQHQRAIAQSVKVNKLEHDLQLLTHSAIGLGKRLVSIEQQLKSSTPIQQAGLNPVVETPSAEPVPTLTDSTTLSHASAASRESAAVASSNPFAPQRPPGARPLYSDANYSDAVRLLDQGIDVDEVARRCGLSKSEVSLMQLMSGHQSAQETLG